MGKSTRFIGKKTDAELVAFFEAAAEVIGASTIVIYPSGQDRQFTHEIGDSDSQYELIRDSALKSLDSISISAGRVSVSVDRRPEHHRDLKVDLSIFDVLIFNVPEDTNAVKPLIDLRQSLSFNELVEKTFSSDFDLSAAAFKDPKSFQTIIKSHQAIVERLQKMTLEVGEQNIRARQVLDDEYIELKRQLTEQVAQERLEAQKANDTERQQLVQRDDEIAERARALDDRDNTHVRRELHEKLKARLADRFKKLDLTPQTRQARLPIHIGVGAALGIFGLLIYIFTAEALSVVERSDSGMVERILVIAKSATASLGFLGVMTWYLRWMNRWFERLADTEFQLKQFELDITRAQWVVETAFEWKMSQTPIPEGLLDNISRNLFIVGTKDEGSDMHPADFLASALLGRASGVKLKVPGGELEYGSKAFKDATTE